jgi:hypothetical protein
MYATEAFHNTAQALAFLSLIGLLLCLWRLRNSDYPGHLIAFALMLGGTLMREAVALAYDPTAWTASAMFLSAMARTFKIFGALLFVRAVTLPRCGEWAWISVGIASLLFAGVLP